MKLPLIPHMTQSSNDRSSQVSLRAAGDTDAETIARLHARQITTGFLSTLGSGFLRRLYRRINRSPVAFVIVADNGRGVIGFVAGSTDMAGLYRSFLWRDGLFIAAPLAWRMIGSWRRALETGRHSGASAQRGRGSELLSIAVDPAWQGHGIGQMLVEAFLVSTRDRGQEAAHVVVGADNEPAIALYRRNGFNIVERFELHAGTESLLMQWDGQANRHSVVEGGSS